jgi:hypothetical protein
MIDTRHARSIIHVWSYRGAKCNSDHFMVKLKYRTEIAIDNGTKTKCMQGRGFHTNILHAFLFSLIHTTCPVHLILLDLIIIIIAVEEYKLRSSSLCSFRLPPVTSSLFCPNILLNILTVCSSLNVRDEVRTHTEPQAKAEFSTLISMLGGSLSPRHGTSSGCGWKRHPFWDSEWSLAMY